MRKLLLAFAFALGLAAPAAAAGYSLSTGPVNSPWPMLGRDSQRSNSATFNGVAPSPSFQKIQRLWSVTIPSGLTSGGLGLSVSLDENENAYMTTGDAIHKLNSSDGSIIWSSTLPASNFSQPAVSADGKVYTSSTNAVVAFNAADGQHLWTFRPIGSTVRSILGGTTVLSNFTGYGSPIITPLGHILVSNDSAYTANTSGIPGIVAVTSTGTLAWGIGGTGVAFNAAAVSTWTGVPDNIEVYFKSANANRLFQAQDSDGQVVLLSSNAAVNTTETSKVAVLPNLPTSDFVHYADVSGNYRLRRITQLGATVWTSTQAIATPLSPFALDQSSQIYMTGNGYLYGYDAATGDITLNLNLDIDSSQDTVPVVVGTDTVLLIAQRNFNTHLYNVDTVAKSLRWRYTINDVSNENVAGITVSTHALYIHTYGSGAHKVHAYSRGNYSAVQISSTPETRSGNYMVSTVTVRAVDGSGNPVLGVPIQLTQTNVTPGIGYTVTPLQAQDSLNFSTTPANGQLIYRVAWDYSAWTPSLGSVISSTLTFTPLGLSSSAVLLQNVFASTFTVAVSTPAIEDNGSGTVIQVTTLTFTVLNGLSAPVANQPVMLTRANFTSLCNATVPESSLTPATVQFTDGAGQATFAYRLRYTEGAILCAPAQALPNVTPLATAYTLGTPAVALNLTDTRASTFTAVYTSTYIASDVGHSTMTVTMYDAVGSTVPGTIVLINHFTPSGTFVIGTNGRHTSAACSGDNLIGYTDSFGKAYFDIDGRGCSAGAPFVSVDSLADTVSSAPIFTPGVVTSTPSVLLETNFLNSYVVSVPTITSVGVSFQSTVTAVNVYGHRLPGYAESGVTLTPLFDQTAVQGTGTLGTSVVSFSGSGGQVVISSQTYNKIEDIQVKATRGSGSIKTGLSGTLIVRGPDHFIVTVPTSAQAGVPFSMTVRAVDASSVPIVGYAATVSLSALNAGNQSLAGAGVLGVTNVNIPANGFVTIANQTYTKAESIVIRASDSGAGVVGVSTYSAVVGAGTPASITLLANPQSTIAGVPSVLTATIYDGYSNPVTNSTATFSVAVGSGIVSLSLANGSVVSAVTSTQAVTDAFGQATAFFSSTNSLSAQANLLRASIGGLARDTTVYTSVLITSAGGAVVNFANPLLRADIPANAYSFSVRMGIQGKAELAAADLALTTAAFAATANTFVSTTVLKVSAVRDSSPSTAAGAGSKLLSVKMPYVVTTGSISVGAYGAQSILVPLSVMRVFKLNQVSSVFEQVLDGATTVDSLNGTISAEVGDPDGIYVLGAPAFTTLTTGSSATVTTALAGGTSAQVIVPQGGFASPATISVTVPGVSSVPALPTRPGLRGTGITVSVSAGGLQPSVPVTIKIGYRAIDVAGINPDHLRLARYDTTTGWVVLDSAADSTTRQVTGTTNHFSLFSIVAQAPGASVADGFVFPNPFRPALGHTNIKLSNLPANAHVKIFTAAGRLLKELDADAAGQVLTWTGTDREGRALASGVYLAVIEGTGGRRTIKFAVQR